MGKSEHDADAASAHAHFHGGMEEEQRQAEEEEERAVTAQTAKHVVVHHTGGREAHHWGRHPKPEPGHAEAHEEGGGGDDDDDAESFQTASDGEAARWLDEPEGRCVVVCVWGGGGSGSMIPRASVCVGGCQ